MAEVADGQATLWSRNGLDLTARFPELATEIARVVRQRDCVLDGEVVVLDERGHPDLRALRAGLKPRRYYIFDVLEADGEPTVHLPLSARRRRLSTVVVKSRYVQIVDWFEDADALWQVVAGASLEGVVAKDLESEYLPGRRASSWVKVKLRRRQVFVITGYVLNSARSLAGLTLAEEQDGQLVAVGRCSTGFSDAEAAKLLATLRPLRQGQTPAGIHRVKPVVRCRVAFSDRTSTGRLHQPSYLGMVRDDEPDGR